jgi:hypothetical protein
MSLGREAITSVIFRLERVRSFVWGFVNISVKNAQNVIVQGIAVEAAGQPDLLRPELGEVAAHQSCVILAL